MPGWGWCIGLGPGLGWLRRYPLVFTYLTGWAIAVEVGWATVDPTLVAGPLTALARHPTPLTARAWWLTSLALWATPFTVHVLVVDAFRRGPGAPPVVGRSPATSASAGPYGVPGTAARPSSSSPVRRQERG